MSAGRTWIFHIAALVATLAVAATNGCGRADLPDARQVSIENFGAANARCTEWSDGCKVCRRQSGDSPAACSLPGIACLPGPITCKMTAP